MADVDDLVSVAEAARRLGITTEQAYELVFSGSLQTVASETGRRLVPAAAIEQRLASAHG
jgi:excisionase family DNA binding protein